jgi:hypothetical protein
LLHLIYQLLAGRLGNAFGLLGNYRGKGNATQVVGFTLAILGTQPSGKSKDGSNKNQYSSSHHLIIF